MTTDVTNMSRYPSLWVMPHRDKVVTVAPLCGSESRPPEEMEAILCSTWGPIPMRAPCSRKVGASASKVAPSPPEADAVMPHNRLTARTSVISGLADIERMKACTMAKMASPLITEPKPTTAQELIRGIRELPAADLRLSFNALKRGRPVIIR